MVQNIRLKDNVCIVKGAENGGVYDFDTGRFYRVPLAAVDILEQIGTGSKDYTTSPCGIEEFVEECRRLELLQQQAGEPRESPRIESLLKYDVQPKFCWLEINSSCNQRCLHCFMGDELNSGTLEYSLIKTVVTQLKGIGVETVAITGGEPLMHKRFLDIVYLLSDAGFRIALLTNGTLLTREVIVALRQKDVLIKLPIFGNQEIHDRMTCLHGSFSKALAAIKMIISEGARLIVTTTISALNLKDMEFVRNLCGELNVQFEPAPIYPAGMARRNWMQLSNNYQEILDCCNRLCEKKDDSVKSCHEKSYCQSIAEGMTPYSICGSENFAVSHDGIVLPCLLLRSKEFHMGLAKDVKAILLKKLEGFKTVQALLDYNNDTTCHKCEARYMCKGGGCRAVPYLFNKMYGGRNKFYADCYYQASPSATNSINCPN